MVSSVIALFARIIASILIVVIHIRRRRRTSLTALIASAAASNSSLETIALVGWRQCVACHPYVSHSPSPMVRRRRRDDDDDDDANIEWRTRVVIVVDGSR